MSKKNQIYVNGRSAAGGLAEQAKSFPPRTDEEQAVADANGAQQRKALDPWLDEQKHEASEEDNALLNNLAAIDGYAQLADNPAARPEALRKIRQVCADMDSKARARCGLPARRGQ